MFGAPALARAAASEPLQGILGYETRPLVSTDFAGDPRSAVVDALSTRVVDGSRPLLRGVPRLPEGAVVEGEDFPIVFERG